MRLINHIRHQIDKCWLTHWGRDKMAAISKTIFSNAFLRMKSVVYRSKFHWSIGLDNGLASNRRQAIIWTNANPIHWRIYAALEGDVLKSEHNWSTSENPLHDYGPATEYSMMCVRFVTWIPAWISTVYPKKYAHGFCFAVLCCGYTLTDFPISIRLTSLTLWQSNDCPSANKATLMNMDKYFKWIHCERFHNHNKAKHNKTVCIFLGIYCNYLISKVWDKTTCPFPKFNGITVEVWEWIIKFTPHFTGIWLLIHVLQR